MLFNVRLLSGLTDPNTCSYQISKAEKITGIWKQACILLVLSAILASIAALLGIGNEMISKQIYELSANEYEVAKALFGLGNVMQETVITLLTILFPSLVFWIFSDSEYRKLIIIQLYVAVIYLIDRAVSIPFQLWVGVDQHSSPFSLGVFAQYLTEAEIIIFFFSNISLFSIWAIVIQYKYLTTIAEKSKKLILAVILSTNLFIWIVSAIFSYIKFEKLF
ncbi:hypothetical protein ACFYKX_14410 [Cytobacillus sp. FJAT-54145]|uniref:Yip1 domain-containing protein n=1 Tax=Cytobacillus spartinae TaxID=3299023 RepID=A0ABW6KC30_9BACI